MSENDRNWGNFRPFRILFFSTSVLIVDKFPLDIQPIWGKTRTSRTSGLTECGLQFRMRCKTARHVVCGPFAVGKSDMPDDEQSIRGPVAIAPATLRDVAFVTANLRPQDRTEIFASADIVSQVEAAVIAVEMSRDFCWTAKITGQPVAAFGVAETSPLTPHIRTAWAFGTDRFRRAVPAISRFATTHWPARLKSDGVRRLEVRALADHDIVHRWLASLGAAFEGTLHCYGTAGEAFRLYAWTVGGDGVEQAVRDHAQRER